MVIHTLEITIWSRQRKMPSGKRRKHLVEEARSRHLARILAYAPLLGHFCPSSRCVPSKTESKMISGYIINDRADHRPAYEAH